METKGNDPSYSAGGYNGFGSTLHWGPSHADNRYYYTTTGYTLPEGNLHDEFHTFGLYWDNDKLFTYLDTEDNKILNVDFTQESFWQRGQFPDYLNNLWAGRSNAAPFD